MSDPDLRSLPLDAAHRALGARMAPFAGWQMPVQYPDGIKVEHLHTRDKAGLFDVSHMGQLEIRPRDGLENTLHRELEAALPLDFDNWPAGQQRYSLLLNDAGGIEDDLMVVNAGDHVRIVVNAGNRDADLTLLRERCPGLDIRWVDAALLALQGPLAEKVLAGFDARAADMVFMQAATLQIDGAPCPTTRSGYTGEDGFEISVPLSAAESVFERLLAQTGVRPVGLGARDSLRLEAGLPLHGSDIGPDTDPVSAGLPFAIPKSRRAGGGKAGGFPGAAKILEVFAHGPRRRLVGLTSYESVPVRAHAPVLDADGRTVGEVTSGTVSPTLGRPVMLAYVDAGVLADGNPHLRARVRQKTPAVMVTPLPFVPKRYKR